MCSSDLFPSHDRRPNEWDVKLLNDWCLNVGKDEKEQAKSRGTIGNAIISDRPKALVLLEIKDDIDMANFKSFFSGDVWIKNNAEQQKMIFDYSYFIEKIK